MPAERYFISDNFLPDTEITLEGQEFHHLAHVMRTRAGEIIELVNGKGQLATAIIVALEKKRAIIQLQNVHSVPPPTSSLVLVQAIPRFPRLEFILEKGTELGMTEIWLFPGLRSEKDSFSHNQSERMHTILVAAMKQCGRLDLPKLSIYPLLKKWDAFPSHSYYGDVTPEAPKLIHEKKSGNLYFFNGPESGFDPLEIEILKKHNVLGVSLHKNILRTDTAAIAALSILN